MLQHEITAIADFVNNDLYLLWDNGVTKSKLSTNFSDRWLTLWDKSVRLYFFPEKYASDQQLYESTSYQSSSKDCILNMNTASFSMPEGSEGDVNISNIIKIFRDENAGWVIYIGKKRFRWTTIEIRIKHLEWLKVGESPEAVMFESELVFIDTDF